MVITKTPLRISFAGGGTDFLEFFKSHGGVVVSTTIDKYVYVIVKDRFDDKIRVGYSKTEMVDSVDELEHELVREAMRKTHVAKGIEVSTMADIPSTGTGLGSSSSVTVGLLNAFSQFSGKTQPADFLARNACEIEVETLKKPIGFQDQYAAAFGNFNAIYFKPDGSVVVEPIAIGERARRNLQQGLMLFYTGTGRDASVILGEQKKNIAKNIDFLGRIKRLAFDVKECIAKGDLDEFGRLLHAGWEQKKSLAKKITNERIDEIYGRALDAGALGGKITGAGGGGFLLLYCPLAHRERVRTALKELRELPFEFERDGSKVIFNIQK